MADAHPCSLIDLGDGRRLRALLTGPAGAPLVVYDAGAFGIWADGWWVKEALRRDHRVLLFDRAGMGGSDPVPSGTEPTPAFHVADLRRLLAALGLAPPFVLVSHSMAGLRAHAYAHLHPDELRGVVFVDALAPRQHGSLARRVLTRQFGRLLRVGTFAARRGLTRPFVRFLPNDFGLSGAALGDKVATYASASHYEASLREVAALDPEAGYLTGADLTALPIAVFASTSVNGLSEADAAGSREGAGYGWHGTFGREDHVSILTGVYAEAIAARVREIEAVTDGAARPDAPGSGGAGGAGAR